MSALNKSKLGLRKVKKVALNSQPCAGGSDQRLPVVANREQDRHARLDGTLAIQLRVEHPQAEDEDSKRRHDADPEDDAPDRVEVGVQAAGGFKDDQVKDARKDGSEREDEVLRACERELMFRVEKNNSGHYYSR